MRSSTSRNLYAKPIYEACVWRMTGKVDETLELCLSVTCAENGDLSSDFRFVRYIHNLRKGKIYSWADFATAVDEDRMVMYEDTADMKAAVQSLRTVAQDTGLISRLQAAIDDENNEWDDLTRIAKQEIARAKSALVVTADEMGGQTTRKRSFEGDNAKKNLHVQLLLCKLLAPINPVNPVNPVNPDTQ
jgi:hypothetical protein